LNILLLLEVEAEVEDMILTVIALAAAELAVFEQISAEQNLLYLILLLLLLEQEELDLQIIKHLLAQMVLIQFLVLLQLLAAEEELLLESLAEEVLLAGMEVLAAADIQQILVLGILHQQRQAKEITAEEGMEFHQMLVEAAVVPVLLAKVNHQGEPAVMEELAQHLLLQEHLLLMLAAEAALEKQAELAVLAAEVLAGVVLEVQMQQVMVQAVEVVPILAEVLVVQAL
jgi:hypothetical protein